MRLAAISDTHGNAVAFEAVVADLKKQSPDAILHLGDVTMRGPQPKECVDLLRSLNPLAVVRGNYDNLFTRWPFPGFDPSNPKHALVLRSYEYDVARLTSADQEWLGNLPEMLTMHFDGVQTELFHASPRSLREMTHPWATLDQLCALPASPDTRLVLYGHMHHAYARQARGVLVVNAGAIGIPFDGDPRASYAIIDIEGGNIAVQLRRVAYNTEAAIAIARERKMPDLAPFEHGVRHGRYPYGDLTER